ncbi:MAG: hypothetical protein ACP5F8_00230 [Candidatus Aenigmatarchaeota archaeon]
MNTKKVLVLITFFLGIIAGLISYLSKSYLLAIALTISIYFSSYLAFRKFFDIKEFIKETLIGYFGLWIIVWIILFNLL